MLNPKVIKSSGHDLRFISEQIKHAHYELGMIKMHLVEASLKVSSDRQLANYISVHQRALIRVVDTLFTYQQRGSKNSIYSIFKTSSIASLYIDLYERADEVLTFFEREFHAHFDLSATIPTAYKKLMTEEINSNRKYLRKRLAASGIPEGFVKVILDPFDCFLSNHSFISYRELLFIKEFQRKLYGALSLEPESNFAKEIESMFFYLNYNSVHCFTFLISRLQENADGIFNLNDRIQFYSLQLKLIHQQPVKPGFVYRPMLTTIKEQVGSWIAEELYFLEKKQSSISIAPELVSPRSDDKVHTSLSVAHLSLAVKLLIDAKLITNKNSAELMRIVARNFRTDKAEHISEDSLRNKSYNVESCTVDKMRDVIIGLMNKMRDYKG